MMSEGSIEIGILDNDPCALECITAIVESYLRRQEQENKLPTRLWGTTIAVEAMQKCKESTTILLLDMQLDCVTGIQVAKFIRRFNESICIIGITSFDIATYTQSAQQAGMSILLDKATLRETLPSTLDHLLFGGSFTTALNAILTDNEIRFLVLSLQGLCNKQIARAMGISLNTVFSHRNRIKQKLHTNDWNQVLEECRIWQLDKTNVA